jgi:hypothetical protein
MWTTNEVEELGLNKSRLDGVNTTYYTCCVVVAVAAEIRCISSYWVSNFKDEPYLLYLV